MKALDLIFIGIAGSVVALHRETGEQAWAVHLKGSDFVNVVLENGKLLATCRGEVFCLNPVDGMALWHNPLKGLGRGLATIASEGSLEGALAAVQAEKHRRDQQAADSGTVAAVT
jgi:hypothetical protein